MYISKASSPHSWTKLWQDGWDGSTWAITKLRAGSYTGKRGQHSIKLPNLVAGDYILRPEIIALHEGYRQGGTQFYAECIHIKVSGSGTISLPNSVSFPGAYKATDPGILIDIYKPFTSYTIPGPKVGIDSTPDKPTPGGPTTFTTSIISTPTGSSGTVALYQQCGGMNWKGDTVCVSPYRCLVQYPYYSQCLP